MYRYSKDDTIIAKNLKSNTLSDKLNEILKMIETFVYFNKYYPRQLLLSYETYEQIQNERKDLISIFDDEEYFMKLKIVF